MPTDEIETRKELAREALREWIRIGAPGPVFTWVEIVCRYGFTSIAAVELLNEVLDE